MLIIIILGLLVLRDDRQRGIELDVSLIDDIGNQLDAEPLSIVQESSTNTEEVIVNNVLPEVDDPFAAPPEIDITLDAFDATSPIEAPQIGLALQGREEGMKEALLAAYGGNARSEAAVQLALAWLAKQQRSDGSWSLKGPYSDAAGFENTASATAMALLAFQGAGHTHRKGKYKDVVSRGMAFLLTGQQQDGNFFSGNGSPQNNWFYTHGQCTIAICELYGMTGDSQLRDPAQRALDYCSRTQDESLGGWRYFPGNESDLSVTGWVLMGLQSGLMSNLQVPPRTLAKVDSFLDRVAAEGGSRYAYVSGAAPTSTMTAEGLLCRQYLGWSQTDPRMIAGVEYLLQPENVPSWQNRNVYYWYYATQVMHHMEGRYWPAWNSVMRDLLVDNQVTKGAEAGSWHPTSPEPDRWGFHGGRLYVTCLSVYILEIYYRHMPLYSKDVLLAR